MTDTPSTWADIPGDHTIKAVRCIPLSRLTIEQCHILDKMEGRDGLDTCDNGFWYMAKTTAHAAAIRHWMSTGGMTGGEILQPTEWASRKAVETETRLPAPGEDAHTQWSHGESRRRYGASGICDDDLY